MKKMILMAVAAIMATTSVNAQNNDAQVYIQLNQMPELLEIMPEPPAFDSPEFANDVVRYEWGKQQRQDEERVALAIADAEYATGFTRCLSAHSQFLRHCYNADRLARRAAGVAEERGFLRPEHICTPMLRSACEAAFAAVEPEILASLSPLRTSQSISQYFFTDYMLFAGKALDRRIPKRHFSLATTSTNRICTFLEQSDRAMVCINDVKMSQERFRKVRKALLSALERHFPRRSRFEL